MSGFKLVKFEGLAPKVEPHLLPPSRAQKAKNCDLQSGSIVPWKSPSSVWTTTKSGTIKSLYLFGADNGLTNNQWFHWATDVDVVRGPIAGDVTERTYYTGDTNPKVTRNADALSGSSTNYPVVSYLLGVPAPSSAPTLSVTGAADDDLEREDRIYVYTLVTEYGEEGPPSAASSSVEVNDGQEVTVTLPAAPSGNYAWSSDDGALKRIYRSASAGSVTGLQFVAQVTMATTSYEDTTSTDSLAETLPSGNWTGPPDSSYVAGQLLGLTGLANGVLAGFTGNELHFSEPFMPHAWPEAYRQTLDYDVVGLGSTSGGLIVGTKGQPYIIQGSSPSSMMARKLDVNQACASKRSMASMGDYAIYASPDGLVVVSGMSARVATNGLLTRDQWQEYKPDSILGLAYEGRYIGFYDTGSVQGAFIFDLRDSVNTFTEITGVHADGGYYHVENDNLYLLISGAVKKWNGSSTELSYTWKSKKYVSPKPVNMAVAQVAAEDYNDVTLKLYADGVLKHTETITNGNAFRLPAGYLAKNWEIELTGKSRVTEAFIAESIRELQSV